MPGLQHPVPPKLLVHIGDLTASFALLENAIQQLAGSLIAEHQRIGQIITAELAFKNLRALVISLYLERHGEGPDFAELRELMRRASMIEEKRNQITHSLWGAGPTADTVTRIKATAKEKHGIRFHFEQIGEPELVEMVSELKLLALDIQKYWIRLMEAGKLINNPAKPVWGTKGEV